MEAFIGLAGVVLGASLTRWIERASERRDHLRALDRLHDKLLNTGNALGMSSVSGRTFDLRDPRFELSGDFADARHVVPANEVSALASLISSWSIVSMFDRDAPPILEDRYVSDALRVAAAVVTGRIEILRLSPRRVIHRRRLEAAQIERMRAFESIIQSLATIGAAALRSE